MNKLTVVCNKLIYKRYGSTEKCASEFNAWKQFSKLVPQNIAPLVVKTNDLCVFEYLTGTEISLSKKDLSVFAGKLLVDVYNKYKPDSYKKGSLWRNSLNQLIEEYASYKKTLKHMGLSKDINKISKGLETLKHKHFDNITFLHRDIHKGNIISVNNNYYLIDHEHAMEGPIELELQNSLFWNDQMSLNTKVIKNIIRTSGIKYSDKLETNLKDYYTADQIIMALRENNVKKVNKLIKIYSAS